jgi:hypothetical protein
VKKNSAAIRLADAVGRPLYGNEQNALRAAPDNRCLPDTPRNAMPGSRCGSTDLGDRIQTRGTFSLFYTYLNDKKFGAVQW